MNKNITLNQNRKAQSTRECLICGDVKSDIKAFMPCNHCHKEFLTNGVLLVEVLKDEATGRVMVIRDIAFEQVFNQSVPKEKVIKVEIGILQRMQNHIQSVK